MDFIERWLQLSPDGGNGMLEACYLALLLGSGGLLLWRKRLPRLWGRVPVQRFFRQSDT